MLLLINVAVSWN